MIVEGSVVSGWNSDNPKFEYKVLEVWTRWGEKPIYLCGECSERVEWKTLHEHTCRRLSE